MPTLADIYSGIDTAKRKAGNFIRQPLSTLQEMTLLAKDEGNQAIASINDKARQLNQQTALSAQGARQELRGQPMTPEQAAADQQLNKDLIDSYNVGGITVFHGGPHKFAKFDLSKMGTGEGNQSYGWGSYLADARPVAEDYARMELSGPANVAFKLKKAGIDPLPRLKEIYPHEDENWLKQQIQKAEEKGHIYKVDLPDKHVVNMLDYDEELKNQSAKVRQLAKKLGIDLNDIGFDLLQKVGRDKAGSEVLKNAGIPGIKYLDQMSRNAGDWNITPASNTVSGKWILKDADYTSKGLHFDTEEEALKALKEKRSQRTKNYVVFDPEHLTILERNDKPIK